MLYLALMEKFKEILLLLTCLALPLSSDEVPQTIEPAIEPAIEEKKDEFTPWFTGPIIAPRSTAVPLGTIEFDNYLYFITYTGAYNSQWNEVEKDNFYALNPQLLYYFGLTPWMDIEIAPSFLYQFTQNQQTIDVGDTTVALDFQLYENDNFWFPSVKFTVSELFPTGKYEKFNPSKLGTDFTGYGTYGTGFTLLFYKIYPLFGQHAISLSLAGIYTVNTKTHVEGFNAYGGGYGTNGTISVGNSIQGSFSFEYSLDQNWNFALDTLWVHTDISPFAGEAGVDELGDPASVGSPSSESLSFCPAIEYGFTENMGIIGGCWFTAIGRNVDVFRTAAINFYCAF